MQLCAWFKLRWEALAIHAEGPGMDHRGCVRTLYMGSYTHGINSGAISYGFKLHIPQLICEVAEALMCWHVCTTSVAT